jgi:mRNA interferase MazF
MNNEFIKLIKLFKSWSELKPVIHISENNAYPKAREIWWVSLGQNIGVEMNGKNNNFERPVVIIKVFNTKSSLTAPISSKVRVDQYLVPFVNSFGENNVVNLSQLKTISSKRLLRIVGEMDPERFEDLRRKIKDFI